MVQDVGRQAQPIYPTRQIVVDACAASVVGNADALKQLLWILIDNAARFSPAGGCIRLGCDVVDGLAEVRVTDDGPGIPPGGLKGIFDRFFQPAPPRAPTQA